MTQAKRQFEAKEVKKYLVSLLLLTLQTPPTQGGNEFQNYQERFADPLVNMIEEDSALLDHFNAELSSSIALEDLKPSLTHPNIEPATPSNSQATTRFTKEQTRFGTDQPTFLIPTSTNTQRRPAGESAIYRFSTKATKGWQGNICLSLASSLPGATLSKTSILPGEPFSLTVPTHKGMQWGKYIFTVTASADNGAMVEQQSANLELLPSDLQYLRGSNGNWLPITDNSPDGVQSIIYISEQRLAFGVKVLAKIAHPWRADLQLTLTSPSGTVHKLVNNGDAFVSQQYQNNYTEAFSHEPTQGNWTLTIVDLAAGDTGTLQGWHLKIDSYSPSASKQANAKPDTLLNMPK
ncbi:proprotein convertase P-domain-containing protein [Shewanella marisflavi]|uniref:proprotein convertase P-domain-containing protein n=1 Tax=Shewanella marisflavi TaxID=260364 RepID=UPI003AAF8533